MFYGTFLVFTFMVFLLPHSENRDVYLFLHFLFDFGCFLLWATDRQRTQSSTQPNLQFTYKFIRPQRPACSAAQAQRNARF
jgi:hypothetical protein